MLKKRLHILFEASAFVKAITSVGEMILGILFFVLSSQTINKTIFFIFGDELNEQPRDPIWVFLLHGFNGISSDVQHFWGIIFILHGATVMFLVIGLIKKKFWIYPVAALVFTALLIYQVIHILYAPSLLLEFLSGFDVIFIWLIVREYQYQKTNFSLKS